MALSTVNSKQKNRTYTLCRVYNTKGVKGSPMVICNNCTMQVHSKNSCAQLLNTDSKQYICTLCKMKQRRCNQHATTNNARRSAHINTPPTAATSQSSRRSLGRDSQKLTPAFSTVKPPLQTSTLTTVLPGHEDLAANVRVLEAHINKLNIANKDLEIMCANNTTAITVLKQENQRLLGIITEAQLRCRTSHTSHSTSTPSSSALSSSRQSSITNSYDIDHNKFNNNNNLLNNINCTNTLVHFNTKLWCLVVINTLSGSSSGLT